MNPSLYSMISGEDQKGPTRLDGFRGSHNDFPGFSPICGPKKVAPTPFLKNPLKKPKGSCNSSQKGVYWSCKSGFSPRAGQV